MQPTSRPNTLNTLSATRLRLGGISNETMYKLIRTGQISVTKVCNRTMVSDSEIDRFIDANTPDVA